MPTMNRYQNFAELAAAEREDTDYRIELLNRASPYTVMAIHGGKIEPGTSAVARAVAGDDLNLYLFEGLKESGNFRDLHISSHEFDEPRALDLVGASRACITIHGFKERERNWVALGGHNDGLRGKIFAALIKTGLIEQDVENPTGRLPGVDPENIVNRCADGGVQIEISYRLRRLLGMYPKHLKHFAEAIRHAIQET